MSDPALIPDFVISQIYEDASFDLFVRSSILSDCVHSSSAIVLHLRIAPYYYSAQLEPF